MVIHGDYSMCIYIYILETWNNIETSWFSTSPTGQLPEAAVHPESTSESAGNLTAWSM